MFTNARKFNGHKHTHKHTHVKQLQMHATFEANCSKKKSSHDEPNAESERYRFLEKAVADFMDPKKSLRTLAKTVPFSASRGARNDQDLDKSLY